MASPQLILLMAVFFLTSIVSVITGSTSLITVPVMLGLGIEPRTAIATNMFALMFMSLGGALPFLRNRRIDRQRLPGLVLLTLAGSGLGAVLLLWIPSASLSTLISVFMLAIAVFSIVNWDAGIVPKVGDPSRLAELGGYVATFGLGIYGGLFSGGYVTLLTVVYVSLFRMTFVEAIGITKLINLCSSLVAVLIFAKQGILDYQLGILLGFTMFVGGMIGGRTALLLNQVWLKSIFLVTVIGLALKLLLFHDRVPKQSNS
jgi:uncharacterized protein